MLELTNVLLVEDSPDYVALFTAAMSTVQVQQFRFQHVETLAEALAALRDRTLELVLLDLSLPDCDGLETLRRVLETRGNVPIVVLTGLDDEEMAVQAVRNGAQDYLVKGDDVNASSLLRSMRYAIERRRAAEALLESEQRFRTLADSAPVMIWMGNASRQCEYVNRNWLEYTGLAMDQAIVGCGAESINPEDLQRRSLEFEMAYDKWREYRVEYRLRRFDGEYRWFLETASPRFMAGGQFIGLIGSCIDIHERKLAEQQLVHRAFFDTLTPLYNRELLVNRLELAVARHVSPGHGVFALLLIDLDRFELINNRFGHVAGDKILIQVAQRLRTICRVKDTIARMSADRFGLLLEDLDSRDAATQTAERIQQAVREPLTLVDQQVTLTASVGVVVSGGKQTTPDELIEDADAALQQAKALGTGKYVIIGSGSSGG